MREKLQGVLLVTISVGGIVVGFLKLGDARYYEPWDIRSNPWFFPVVAGIFDIFAAMGLVAGVRLLRGRKSNDESVDGRQADAIDWGEGEEPKARKR